MHRHIKQLLLPTDATELEFYSTGKQNSGTADSWEYRIEVEQGITPKFDFSVYQIFSQTEGASLKWNSFQLRSRYRFGLAGEISFNPVLYLEYRHKLDNQSGQNKLEWKLLVGKDFYKTNISLNPVYEYLWATGYDSYQEIGIDAGISYSPSFKFSFGVESSLRNVFYSAVNKEDKFESALGPTISIASGHTYYTLGVLFGLNDESDDVKFRLLMGVGL